MYTPIIGMEIHVELKTKSKMFCSCKNEPELSAPNSNICEICLAHPGTLPVPNKQAIIDTVLIGKSLNCQIRELSKFDRKHYFYPDLPKGYQISQYDEPIAEYGYLDISFILDENIRPDARIGIRRAHLEEDTARLLHDTDGSTLADFNRAGTPLVEIVTDPDFKTALEAKTFCQELRTLLRTLGVSDADMEKGHMRCEANISVQEAGKFEIVNREVRPLGDYKLHAKVEVKNINSFKAVEKAIEYEIKRQTEMIEKGEPWIQQTRGWDDPTGTTVLQRVKENAADYRYFPEPDIPPFHPLAIAGDVHIPELPQAKRKRFHEEYGFSHADAKLLTDNTHWANFGEQTMGELTNWIASLPETKGETDDIQERQKQKLARLAGGWITSKLMGAMKERSIDIRVLKLSPENFAELIALVYANRINSTNAQKLLGDMLDSNTDTDPTHLMEEKGYGQISDEGKITDIIAQVIVDNPIQVEQFKAGKEPLIKFLIGMVMKASEGSADPIVVEKLLREQISQ